jgi:hypothetical protein
MVWLYALEAKLAIATESRPVRKSFISRVTY